uniref:Disease resistance R13L4/SHOC-2-like LRR domain-containing protein n=2 Tax=Grammatophora oceanica TaxID=210454 RepID=A0A7S1YD40_9STRA|mmetsp:Transcript_40206/g.59631  ORF Transcript_40206/g.59631 Transcript_40206/m.59631 type:complete len:237 (+) Transcript_40206:187-897(+)
MPSVSFEDSTSPQRQALDWMLGDSYSLEELKNDGDDRIVQRFALAVFYYSTNGPTSWDLENRDGWLLSSTECDWGERSFGPDVECSNNNVVDRISLWSDGLSGTIPREIGLLSSLTFLGLSRNNLEGTIPTEFGLLSSLTSLLLYVNILEGTIPSEIGLLTSLTGLYLYNNANLSGRVPTELANLSNLEELYLYNTQLTGSIQSDLCSTLTDAAIDCGEIECDCCTSSGSLGVTPC